MKQSLARILFAASDLLASTHFSKLKPLQISPMVSSSSPLLSACRLFSSETSAKPSESNLDQSHTEPGVPDSETISNAAPINNFSYIPKLPLLSFSSSNFSYSSFSENDSVNQNPDSQKDPVQALPPDNQLADAENQNKVLMDVEDVDNKEFKQRLEEYLNKGKEEALPSIAEAVFQRSLKKMHEETDEELIGELQMEPLENVDDREFESDLEEILETDEEIDNLYSASDIVKERMTDYYSNMNDAKWDEIIKEGIEEGCLTDMRECEEVLQDMLSWDKLLPDEIKKKVEEKFEEIAARVEKGELEVKEGYDLFKEFEDQMVQECIKLMDAEGPPEFDETAVPDKKKDVDDPPGEGPILRWQTRVVLSPGGDSWHPKNRKVKLSVTVKELGLSKHQYRRLRELVGKRYDAGRDELTITSERFEHREENRKDCLRTLLSLIEEAGKANKLVEDAQTAHLKGKLRSNPNFMARLNAKKGTSISAASLPA